MRFTLMSREIATAAVILLALAGCRGEPSADVPVEAVNATNEASPPLPDADINASLGLLGEDADMPDHATGTDRFIGRWAVHEGLCENAAWTFTAEEMRTPTGSACRFTQVSEVAGGYDIAASCTSGGEAREDRLQLRFPQSAGGLLFDAEHILDAGLVRCEE